MVKGVTMTKEKIGTEQIMREKGHLYYVGGDGHVYKVKRGTKGKVRVSKMAVKREPGYLYFLSKEGYVHRAMMSRGKKHKVKG